MKNIFHRSCIHKCLHSKVDGFREFFFHFSNGLLHGLDGVARVRSENGVDLCSGFFFVALAYGAG